jgi:hypothetical protein
MVVVTSAAVLCLSACQSSSETASTATCDQASLQTTIETFFHESQSHLDSINQLDCSGDWAAVQATVTEDGGKPAEQVFIFARTGENWILKAPEIVCGSSTADGSRPADAEIPADIWEESCTTA